MSRSHRPELRDIARDRQPAPRQHRCSASTAAVSARPATPSNRTCDGIPWWPPAHTAAATGPRRQDRNQDPVMKRTNGSLARRARPLFVVATLVSLGRPGVHAGRAGGDRAVTRSFRLRRSRTEPRAGPDPRADARPDALSEAGPDGRTHPDPRPIRPRPTPIPRAPTRPRPRRPRPGGRPRLDALGRSGRHPDTGAVRGPDPRPAASPTPAPTLPPPGPRALTLDATKGQHATVADDRRLPPAAFTVETWFRRAAPRDRRPGRHERRQHGDPRPANPAPPRRRAGTSGSSRSSRW